MRRSGRRSSPPPGSARGSCRPPRRSPRRCSRSSTRPAIQLVVEEAVRAGLTDILIITGRNKRSIEDHFDRDVELEVFLEEKGKFDELKQVRALSEMADIHFIRQGEALGLGHAVSIAEPHVGGEPFAVLLGDDLIHPSMPLLRRDAARPREVRPQRDRRAGGPAARRSRSTAASRPSPSTSNLARVVPIVEKPAPADAPSNLAAIGRYVFTPEIFDAIRGHEARRGATRSSSPTPSTCWRRSRRCTPTSSITGASTWATSSTT